MTNKRLVFALLAAAVVFGVAISGCNRNRETRVASLEGRHRQQQARRDMSASPRPAEVLSASAHRPSPKARPARRVQPQQLRDYYVAPTASPYVQESAQFAQAYEPLPEPVPVAQLSQFGGSTQQTNSYAYGSNYSSGGSTYNGYNNFAGATQTYAAPAPAYAASHAGGSYAASFGSTAQGAYFDAGSQPIAAQSYGATQSYGTAQSYGSAQSYGTADYVYGQQGYAQQQSGYAQPSTGYYQAQQAYAAPAQSYSQPSYQYQQQGYQQYQPQTTYATTQPTYAGASYYEPVQTHSSPELAMARAQLQTPVTAPVAAYPDTSSYVMPVETYVPAPSATPLYNAPIPELEPVVRYQRVAANPAFETLPVVTPTTPVMMSNTPMPASYGFATTPVAKKTYDVQKALAPLSQPTYGATQEWVASPTTAMRNYR